MKPLHNHPIVKKAQELYEKHGYDGHSRLPRMTMPVPDEPKCALGTCCEALKEPFTTECEEDHNGNCYHCGRNMLEPTEKECNCCDKCNGTIRDENNFGTDYGCLKEECTCHSPTKSSDWMEEFEKYEYAFDSKTDYLMVTSFIAEKIEVEHERVYALCSSQIPFIEDRARIEEREKIVKIVEDKYVSQIHQKDCEYQRDGCDCGYMERSSYNHALDELLANLKSNENI